MSGAGQTLLSRRLLLLDGPLHDKHGDVIARMADDLVRLEATGDERIAIRALMPRYPWGQIVVLLDDALAEARQRAVTGEMAKR